MCAVRWPRSSCATRRFRSRRLPRAWASRRPPISAGHSQSGPGMPRGAIESLQAPRRHSLMLQPLEPGRRPEAHAKSARRCCSPNNHNRRDHVAFNPDSFRKSAAAEGSRSDVPRQPAHSPGIPRPRADCARGYRLRPAPQASLVILSRHETDSRAGRSGRGDTVTDTVDTVIGSRDMSPDTVNGGLRTTDSALTMRTWRASSLKVIRTGGLMHCSVTVDLSVSGRFEGRAQRAFPLRRTRLLTIEWE